MEDLCQSIAHTMNTTKDEAFFQFEAARILKEEVPPNSSTLPTTVRKTATTDESGYCCRWGRCGLIVR